MPGFGEFMIGGPAGILQQLPDDGVIDGPARLELIGKGAPPLPDEPVKCFGGKVGFIAYGHNMHFNELRR